MYFPSDNEVGKRRVGHGAKRLIPMLLLLLLLTVYYVFPSDNEVGRSPVGQGAKGPLPMLLLLLLTLLCIFHLTTTWEEGMLATGRKGLSQFSVTPRCF